MHNRQGLTLKLLWEALSDYDMWPIYVYGLVWNIPSQPITAYLTLNLKTLGFDTFQTNLLTVPAYVLFLTFVILFSWLSEEWDQRFPVVLFTQFWYLPLVLALALLPATASPWAWYAVSALLIGYVGFASPSLGAAVGELASLTWLIDTHTRILL